MSDSVSAMASRSIPAWAGKPSCVRPRVREGEVHPRVGGETTTRPAAPADPLGPSPRGRGNRVRAAHGDSPRGSIPAWAGKPRSGCARRLHPRGSIPAWAGKPRGPSESHVPSVVHPRVRHKRWVHPRVGGETQHADGIRRGCLRVHPRVGGETPNGQRSDVDQGSIPAWAGKPGGIRRACFEYGSIPAWAGHDASHAIDRRSIGPSPRGRGNLVYRPRIRRGLHRLGPSPRGRGNQRHDVGK